MKINRRDLKVLFDSIISIIENEKVVYSYGLMNVLIRNKYKIRPFIEELAEQKKEFEKQGKNIFLKYSKKDENNNLKKIAHGQFPEFDKEIEDLNKISNDYYKEEVEFEEYRIDHTYAPKENDNINGAMAEILFYLLK